MPKLEELKTESTTAYQKRKNLETKLIKCKQELGALLLSEGSGSSAYREAVKRLHAAEDDLEEIRTLQEALNSAIKQGEREEKKKYMAELLKQNLAIVEKYRKNLPECPKCKTNKFVELTMIEPRQYNEPSDTREIRRLTFLCTQFYVGHEFFLTPEDWEPLTEKIGETVKKIGSTVASVLF